MSKEVYENLDLRNSLVHSFVFQCAPVLSAHKVSNLFIIRKNRLRRSAALIASCGLNFFILYSFNDRYVLFVYRRAALKRYLDRPENKAFLEAFGYGNMDENRTLEKLSRRYTLHMESDAQFPHELGLFLGYPLQDVYSYIIHNGKGFIFNGYWKVYSRPEEAKKTFEMFDRVTEEMLSRAISGENLPDIIKNYAA